MDKTIFKTIDEAVSEVTKYCKDNNHPVRLGSRTTVAQYNKKTKDDANITDLPGSTIYALRWVCKHFGSERERKATDNDADKPPRKRMHLLKGCKFFIYVAWSKDRKEYVLRTSKLEHNHAHGADLYRLYPSSRKLDSATAATVDGMLRAGAQPTMVADMLHANDIMVSTRDVYNMRQQSKFKGQSERCRHKCQHVTFTTCANNQNSKLKELMAENSEYIIGQSIHQKTSQLLDVFDTWFDEQFLWIDEVLAEAKKTMAVESILLLPKTPTHKKRMHQRSKRKDSDDGTSKINISSSVSRTYTNKMFESHEATESTSREKHAAGHFSDNIVPEEEEETLACFYPQLPVINSGVCINHPSEDHAQMNIFPALGDRKSLTHLPNSEESSSGCEYERTTNCLPLTTSEGHRAKVVRKSRKFRTWKALSLNCKQTSVAVQTESEMTFASQQCQLTDDNRTTSTGTQTDNVVVINVSQQLHTSADVPDGLFKSGHSSLLPDICMLDALSVNCGRNTDSGHVSDADNKLLSASVESICQQKKEVSQDTVTNKLFASVSECHNVEEMSGATVVQDIPTPVESIGHDNVQQNEINMKSAAASWKLSSASECVKMSRWTTATRLDVLDEKEEMSTNQRPETFFASLESPNSKETALADEMHVVGILASLNHKESNLLFSSSGMTTSVYSQSKSSASCLHSDVVVSSHKYMNNSQCQLSAGTDHVSKVSRESLLNGTSSPPSASSYRGNSKGSRQSHNKPRLSVGRKSLSGRRSVAAHGKCPAKTKISRPAAWLMNATKASRSKVVERQISREVTATSSSVKHTASTALRGTSSARHQHNVHPSNSSLSPTPSRVNSTHTRSKIQKLQSLFSPKSNTAAAADRSKMPPPLTPVVKRAALCPPPPSDARTSVALRGKVGVSPGRLRDPPHQRIIDTSSSSRAPQSQFTLQCFSPRRSSSLQSATKSVVNGLHSERHPAGGKLTNIPRSSSARQHVDTPQTMAKRGLFHRLHDRLKVTVHDTHVKPKNMKKKMLNVSPPKTLHKQKSNLQQLKSTAAAVDKQQHLVNNMHQLTDNECNEASDDEELAAVDVAMIQAESVSAALSHSDARTPPVIECSLVSATQHEDDVDECNNYDISDLCSDDSTDDELDPRKNLPAWANETRLMSWLLHFESHPVDPEQLFGHIQPPDLNVMFDVKRPRFDKRTSSANWEVAPSIGLLEHYVHVAYAVH